MKTKRECRELKEASFATPDDDSEVLCESESALDEEGAEWEYIHKEPTVSEAEARPNAEVESDLATMVGRLRR